MNASFVKITPCQGFQTNTESRILFPSPRDQYVHRCWMEVMTNPNLGHSFGELYPHCRICQQYVQHVDNFAQAPIRNLSQVPSLNPSKPNSFNSLIQKPRRCRTPCCVPGCGAKSGRMYRFPKESDLGFRWLEAIKNPILMNLPYRKIYPKCRVCYRHFFSEDVIRQGSIKSLKKNIIPTQNIPCFSTYKCINQN